MGRDEGRWRRKRVIGSWKEERWEFLKEREVQGEEEGNIKYAELQERDKRRQEEER